MVKRNNEKNKRIGFFGWSEEEKVDFMHLRSPRLSKVPSPEASQLEEKNQFSFDKVSFTHSYVSSDECILKKGESYHVTETGRKRVHRMRDRREVH